MPPPQRPVRPAAVQADGTLGAKDGQHVCPPGNSFRRAFSSVQRVGGGDVSPVANLGGWTVRGCLGTPKGLQRQDGSELAISSGQKGAAISAGCKIAATAGAAASRVPGPLCFAESRKSGQPILALLPQRTKLARVVVRAHMAHRLDRRTAVELGSLPIRNLPTAPG
jgi:hypothetical protein